jgi:hypothetical protein
MTYKGDSPGKKLARLNFWSQVLLHLGSKRFFSGKHLVLASQDGGDIQLLMALGVRPHHIIAVDLDQRALEVCRRAYPDVRYEQGDVAKIVEKYSRSLECAYLDFCGPLSDAMMDRARRVVGAGMKDRSLIGMTFMHGREKGEKRLSALELKDQTLRTLEGIGEEDARKAFAQCVRAGHRVVRDLTFEQFYAQQKAELSDTHHMDRMAGISARFEILGYEMVKMSHTGKCAPLGVYLAFYRSTTATNRGTTMLTYLGRVVRGLPSWNQKKFQRKLSAMLREMMEAPLIPEHIHVTDDKAMREAVLGLCENFADVSDRPADEVNSIIGSLFGVSAGTIRAWKAHDTRARMRGEGTSV